MKSTESIALVITFSLALAAMRVTGMLGPAGLRWLLPLGFLLMAVTPWILLNKEGRRKIGLAKPVDFRYLFYGIAGGVCASIACFLIAYGLFEATSDNWFVSIAKNYRKTLDTTGFTTIKLHLVFTIPAMLFSPIGEEIFFRGVLQETLEQRLSASTSTNIECTAFGIVHLCHHGLVAGTSGLHFLPFSGVLWIGLMFLVARMFAWLRKRSLSLPPAIAAHCRFQCRHERDDFFIPLEYAKFR